MNTNRLYDAERELSFLRTLAEEQNHEEDEEDMWDYLGDSQYDDY